MPHIALPGAEANAVPLFEPKANRRTSSRSLTGSARCHHCRARFAGGASRCGSSGAELVRGSRIGTPSWEIRFASTCLSWPRRERARLAAATSRSSFSAGWSRMCVHHSSAIPLLIAPVKSCLHVRHSHHPLLLPCAACDSAAWMRQPMCASPASPRQAHPIWIGGGLVSRQTKHAPASAISGTYPGVPSLGATARPPQWRAGKRCTVEFQAGDSRHRCLMCGADASSMI